jgi:acyl carrier protein
MTNHHARTGLSRLEISAMVISSLEEVLVMANGDSPDPATVGEDVYLIGREAVLDSMGLVNLIVEVEQRLEEEYDLVLVLADERAMSQRKSPFRSVRSLTDYICQLVDEQSSDA